jgi:transcriptional regulator with XRE-family HTH domain
MSVLGERIKHLRTINAMSQNELAHKIGSSQTQVWKYETGQNEPTSGVIINLAKALNTSPDYLLGFTDDPERKVSVVSDLTYREKAIIQAVRSGKLEDVVKTFMAEG